TRTAFLDYLDSIGCDVAISNRSVVSEEPRGTIKLSGAQLKGRKISGQSTASLIDEIPIIAVIACFANSTTVIRDAAELRVKESDRIESIAKNLRKMGAKVGVLEDGMVIETEGELQPADFESFGDHRIAMAMSVASLFLPGNSTLDNESCINVSCPGFYDYLGQIKAH
ncbi:MAG: 3-phosphoshikimate 1-carboxyvinyltransferase, partial [candidate division Zixibacteria bacterium]|nr:3-phosphoshikimate 1-carboxyvinyltransferase [candidate division Zixibacteria bacterium]